MRDEQKLHEDAVRGERAKQILNDKLVQDALKTMKENVYTNIQTSHFKDIEEREHLYKMLKAIDAFEKEFERHIRGGQKARSLLDKLLNKGE